MELKNFYALDNEGNVLPGATCYLYLRGTESMATGLLKANGVGLVSPFAANDDGLVQLAAPSGLYDLRVVKGDRDSRIPVQFNDVTADLLSAQTAAVRSEAARDAAQLAAGLKDSIEHGLATTVSGQHFTVAAPGSDGFLILYKNQGGAAVKVGVYPSATAVEEVLDRLGDNDQVVLAVTDDAGYTGFEVKGDSIKTAGLEISTDRLRMGDQGLEREDSVALAVVDEHGFVGFVVDLEGNQKGNRDQSLFSAEEILTLNQEGLRSSAAVTREYNTEVARPVWDYNHFMEYGQSLSTGFEGWPALSKTPRLGNLMLGDSVRPASRTAGEFVPLGEAVLTPLKAVVQDLTSGVILSDEEVAALAPGLGNEGEATVIGMTNLAKKLHNQRLQVSNDDSRTFVASCCGVAGMPIERLMKGDSTNRWLRLTQAAQKVRDVCVAGNKTYGLVALAFLQGEFNYSGSWNGVFTREEYKEKLSTLYDDIESDIVSAIAGQAEPPLFLTYQTGAAYTRDNNDLAIGMAQWELSQERRNWVMATPVYPYPDKGGHLTGNGYRWVGKQFAKVWHRVVELGQNWKPLSPLQVVVKGRGALINFHVPHPPLAFDKPYVTRMATDYASKGFSAVDSAGDLVVTIAEIVADCVVKLSFARDPVGQVHIRYADKIYHNGNGCLRDSDPTVSDDVYVYNSGSGQYADENIPELVGRPYPLYNWCIAFHIPALGAK